VERLLRDAAKGRIALVTGPPVLFELAWTLRRAYKVPRERSIDILASLLAVDGLELTDRATVIAAIAIARASGQEFADAYILAAALAARTNGIATFDAKHFQRMGATLYELPTA
jgi:predicted nucleic acid-binding protein